MNVLARISRLTAILAMLAGLAACATPGTPSSSKLRVEFETDPLRPADPGSIYLSDRQDGGADLRVEIRRDSTWSLAREIEPDWYGLAMRSGPIRNGVAVGFPTELLAQADSVFVRGSVRAWIGRTELLQAP